MASQKDISPEPEGPGAEAMRAMETHQLEATVAEYRKQAKAMPANSRSRQTAEKLIRVGEDELGKRQPLKGFSVRMRLLVDARTPQEAMDIAGRVASSDLQLDEQAPGDCCLELDGHARAFLVDMKRGG